MLMGKLGHYYYCTSARITERHLGEAAVMLSGISLFLFPVNLGPTRTYDSAIGGNTSSGLGSTDHHGIRDMKFMGAEYTGWAKIVLFWPTL